MLASERFAKVQHSRDLAKYRVARHGTIVADPMLLWDGSIGLQDVVDAGLVSPDYRVYELIDQVSSDFMRHVVRNPRMLRHYQGGARGTNVRRNRIARGDFLRIPLRLPPLQEQRRIAAILSTVDQVVDRTNAVIRRLQALKMAMAQELLTRGLRGLHSRFKQTEIGAIPEAWEVASPRTVGAVQAGKAKNSVSSAPMRPYLRVANVFDGRIDTSDVLNMPFTDEEFARYCLEDRDVLLNEGQSLELVGRCSMYRGEYGAPCAIQNALIRFRAGCRITSSFAAQLFRWCQHSGRFAAFATQTTSIAHLGVQRFGEMRFGLPPLDEQGKIATLLDAVDDRVFVEKAAREQLTVVKASLLTVLLNGELRVTPDMDAA
jgi:type I restriction enzyme S subunit